MDREEVDLPWLLDRILEVNHLDDGSPEKRHAIVILLQAVVRTFHASMQRLPNEQTVLPARLGQLESAVAWLERMSHVYSTAEWEVHVRMIVGDARALAALIRAPMD
jgi:hypothetical protein